MTREEEPMKTTHDRSVCRFGVFLTGDVLGTTVGASGIDIPAPLGRRDVS
jgi:hypothetical protein